MLLVQTQPGNQLDLMNLLLGHGADINAVNKSGQTSLMLSALCNNLPAFKALLANQASLEF